MHLPVYNLCTHVAYNTVCVVDYGVFILISDFMDTVDIHIINTDRTA